MIESKWNVTELKNRKILALYLSLLGIFSTMASSILLEIVQAACIQVDLYINFDTFRQKFLLMKFWVRDGGD